MSAPTRRRLLGGAVAVATALPDASRTGGIPVTEMPSTVNLPSHSDVALIADCATFDALERAYVAAASGRGLPGTPEDEAADGECERLAAAQGPRVDRICGVRAITREGQAARARSLALWDAELMKPGKACTGDRLTAAIVRDLLA